MTACAKHTFVETIKKFSILSRLEVFSLSWLLISFSLEERIKIGNKIFADDPKVEVVGFSGLLVNFAKDNDANILIRGLRVVADFEYEFQLANMNRAMSPDIESVFLTPKEEYSYISSSLVKEIATMGGDVTRFVDAVTLEALNQKIKN